jgi:predicted SPOUT superfamily RNA methylase MTH1
VVVEGFRAWHLQSPRAAELKVAVPASLVSDTPHPREKTAKLGTIARICAIFGISEILLYPDDPQRNQAQELDFCQRILSFVETPQYLRKRIFGLHPSLKFTGILPPLQSPNHNVPAEIGKCKVGDFRDGVVVGGDKSELDVDVGLGRTLKCFGSIPVGSRVTVRITNLGKILAGEVVPDSEKPDNWGYRMKVSQLRLGELMKESQAELKVGTSRYGTPVAEIWVNLIRSLNSATSMLVVFGSPKRGLLDVLKDEGLMPKDVFNYFINTVPGQNVATVRTEEAMLTSMSLLNLARHLQA